ncbi:MAG TPA: NAD(P)-dependent oxidoreductase [Acidimicrobiia bacterium]|nr:NAD(P)-dependent oxidoreductase [Acidimicrobiia bacterium]
MTTARAALVTGATGFVGGHLVRRLVRDGWSVHALVRPPLSRAPDGVHARELPCDAGELVEYVASVRPTVCFHVATRFQAAHAPADIAPLVASNVTFPAQLAEAAARSGTPFVNVSSAWQRYEGRDATPTSLYAATKQAFADVLRYYGDVEALRVATLELFDTYGPNDRRPKLVPLLLDAAESGRTLDMSPGEQLIDLVHVDDVVRALLAVADALLAGDARGRLFGARADRPVTLRELVDTVSDVTGRRLAVRWGARPYRPREMFTSWPSPPRPPGWEPTVDLRDGLRALAVARGISA